MTHRVVPRPGLLVSLLAPAVWLLVPACGARQQEAAKPEPPAADTLRTFAHPSDDGQTLNLEWGRSPSEAKDVFYVVEIASEADRQAGRFRRIARTGVDVMKLWFRLVILREHRRRPTVARGGTPAAPPASDRTGAQRP